MFETEAYKTTAEPCVLFNHIGYRKEMAAKKATNATKKAKEGGSTSGSSGDSSDEDDDDSVDADELVKVRSIADELLGNALLSQVRAGTLMVGDLRRAIARKLPQPGALERLMNDKKVTQLLKKKLRHAVKDQSEIHDGGQGGGGGGGLGIRLIFAILSFILPGFAGSHQCTKCGRP